MESNSSLLNCKHKELELNGLFGENKGMSDRFLALLINNNISLQHTWILIIIITIIVIILIIIIIVIIVIITTISTNIIHYISWTPVFLLNISNGDTFPESTIGLVFQSYIFISQTKRAE